MADFNEFESAPQEEDPAAEFLAREQEELAELEGENFEGTNTAAVTEDLFGASETPEATTATTDDILKEFETPASEDPLHESFSPESGFDSYGVQIGDRVDYGDSSSAPQDGYSAITQADKLQQEPEQIKRWREEQKIMLEEKDAEAESKKEEWHKIAEQELVDWYKHRDEQLLKNKANNRESEDVFVKERDEFIPGHEWERICRMCDFNPKTARNQKDVSRMRSILLHLKQNPSEQSA